MRRVLLGCIALVLAACNANETGQSDGPRYSTRSVLAAKEYVFAVQPMHNPARLFQVYGPLIDRLNLAIPDARFRLEASHNYEEFKVKLQGRNPDFALANPYETVASLKHGYHVIAKMADDPQFGGIIVVRRDSGIRRLADLKGRKVCYPASEAFGAAMMLQYYMQTHGLDVNGDIENVYVGSHESSIMNVYLGNAAAGGTAPLAWEAFRKEHPDQARELEAKWETLPLINYAVVARDDVPQQLSGRVAQFLAALHTTRAGQPILARMPLSRFEVADDQRYRVVGDFLRSFSRLVRPVEGAPR